MAQRFVPKNYKVARNGVEIGEFEPFDFIEGVRSGEIRQDDWFWMEGMTDWKPVSDLKILEEFRKLPASPKPQKQRRGWFRRKPTQEKYVQAAFTVASNLYLHTIPGAENPLVPVPLKFNLPDSRFRYLMFCLSTAITAALVYDEKKEVQPEALINGCLHFATGWPQKWLRNTSTIRRIFRIRSIAPLRFSKNFSATGRDGLSLRKNAKVRRSLI